MTRKIKNVKENIILKIENIKDVKRNKKQN